MMKYKEAGVDTEKGDAFVDKISKFIKRTYNVRVQAGVGGFAALYALSDEKWLASGTDGVGTKVMLAQELGIHDTIGQDLVGMCVNDVICTGARPLFFLDYLATGSLDVDVHSQIVKGVADACVLSECALIGGETAEMPGVYEKGVYDLAGFCVGELNPKEWVSGEDIRPGHTLVGVASSGFHSNGYSLIRKHLNKNDDALKKELLTPTKIYWPMVKKLLEHQPENIFGFAHITGSGFENIPRMNEKLGYPIANFPMDDFRPAFMNEMLGRMKLSRDEAFVTFNMGIGFVICCENPERLQEQISQIGEKSIVLGKVSSDFNGLKLL